MQRIWKRSCLHATCALLLHFTAPIDVDKMGEQTVENSEPYPTRQVQFSFLCISLTLSSPTPSLCSAQKPQNPTNPALKACYQDWCPYIITRVLPSGSEQHFGTCEHEYHKRLETGQLQLEGPCGWLIHNFEIQLKRNIMEMYFPLLEPYSRNCICCSFGAAGGA